MMRRTTFNGRAHVCQEMMNFSTMSRHSCARSRGSLTAVRRKTGAFFVTGTSKVPYPKLMVMWEEAPPSVLDQGSRYKSCSSRAKSVVAPYVRPKLFKHFLWTLPSFPGWSEYCSYHPSALACVLCHPSPDVVCRSFPASSGYIGGSFSSISSWTQWDAIANILP
jgi:hypothetical protein